MGLSSRIFSSTEGLALREDSRIGVVGGGPAGSLFSYFLLRMAETIGLEVHVDIYEPRRLSHSGPAGCNHCGGIISESLVQILAAEGINLPSTVVQQGIDSYTVHMDVGRVVIAAPSNERRIAGVFRGNGPREAQPAGVIGFDHYLQRMAAARGATIVPKLVTRVDPQTGGVRLRCADATEGDYDLVALAAGVNSNLLTTASNPIECKPPKTVATFICELYLGQETIEQSLGSSMHVFLLDLPRLEFAALIPKGDYVTLCLLGEHIDQRLVEDFLAVPEVAACFPGSRTPRIACLCFPRLNVGATTPPFLDRIVLVGDTGVSRLYKDGMGAAYRTAKAAASTAVFCGISAQDFRRHFWPIYRNIELDNHMGRVVFAVSHAVQKSRILQRAVLRMASKEQNRARRGGRMSSVLWDVFTGSAPYREILVRTLHPMFAGGLFWSMAATAWRFPAATDESGGAPR